MPRFITVTVGCDWPDCSTVAEEGDGLVTEKTLTVDKGVPKTFLICKTHLDGLNEILNPLLAKGVKTETVAGSKPRREKAGTSSTSAVEHLPCGVPGCDSGGKGNVGLAQHAVKTHGYTDLADYQSDAPDYIRART